MIYEFYDGKKARQNVTKKCLLLTYIKLRATFHVDEN